MVAAAKTPQLKIAPLPFITQRQREWAAEGLKLFQAGKTWEEAAKKVKAYSPKGKRLAGNSLRLLAIKAFGPEAVRQRKPYTREDTGRVSTATGRSTPHAQWQVNEIEHLLRSKHVYGLTKVVTMIKKVTLQKAPKGGHHGA